MRDEISEPATSETKRTDETKPRGGNLNIAQHGGRSISKLTHLLKNRLQHDSNAPRFCCASQNTHSNWDYIGGVVCATLMHQQQALGGVESDWQQFRFDRYTPALFSFGPFVPPNLGRNCMSPLAGTNSIHRWSFALALMVLAASAVGCVERRMTIRSNPPGAQVYVDDYEIGTTPASTEYIYYGTRKIRLVKDGYETLTVYQPMPHPWYDWPGIDFFSENLWPHKIRDERAFEYQMQPLVSVPTEELCARAEQLRGASQVVPAAAAQPITEATTPIAQPAISQPQELPPPVNLGPATVPQSAPGAPVTVPGPIYSAAPPLNTLAPPGNFTPQGGYPAQTPPVALPPSTTPMPNYAPPGGAPSNAPGTAPPFGQPPIPPGWRPISEAPTPMIR